MRIPTSSMLASQHRRMIACGFALSSSFCVAGLAQAAPVAPIAGMLPARDVMTTPNQFGWLRTFAVSGSIDADNAFFQSLGSNGRSCNSCHLQEDAWSITPASVRLRFEASAGTDPIFRTNDGANSPLADVSTVEKRRRAYSMLLDKAVIRVGIGIPAGAEFTLDSVDDPYGFASAAELSLFRRPLPSTNLAFLTGVMWDTRETVAPFLPPMDAGTNQADLVASLRHQVLAATLGHAQADVPPSAGQIDQIVAFELGLTTAQIRDNTAGYLNEGDAIGGPRILANQRFHVGINDTLGADPTLTVFNPQAMMLFAAWQGPERSTQPESSPERRSIARGEQVFNSKPIAITGVGGLNDALDMPVIAGTCTTCHNAPNVGNHTVALPIDIGLTDASRRTADMPLYTLRNTATGELRQTTDPARALLTGKWKDIGKFKGPILRGVVAHAPYFHNGSAASLEEVVDFYQSRFAIGLSAREKRDLVAFLRAL